MNKQPLSVVHNCDCLTAMKEYSDKYFDLAIVDPPYGINRDGQKLSICKNPKHNRKEFIKKDWDSSIPDENYFNELFRVSDNQIIWGANYFTMYLGAPTKGWIFWYKGQNDLTMSDGELAYTSFNVPTRQKEINRVELLKEGTIHPTQKPIALYKWLLTKYAKPNDLILDTHLGSGSSRIAAYQLGFDFIGYELDKEYYDAQEKRFNHFISQEVLFQDEYNTDRRLIQS